MQLHDMKQNKFSTYEDYVDSQKVITRRKMQRRPKCFAAISVIKSIKDYHSKIGSVKNGLCHGVRFGKEIDLLEREFHEGEWVGTEIVDELCDGKRILCMDFCDVPNKWIGNFDLIYSNSFDHVRYPRKVAKAWISCLSDIGRLYIEWSPWHEKLGRGRGKGDCFSANRDEYEALFKKFGILEHTIVLQQKARSGVYYKSILVIKRR